MRLPPDLIEAPRWILWRRVWNGRWDKVPHQARNPERYASTTSPSTWATFDAAAAALPFSGCDGLGFCLGDGFAGVDLDGCLGTDGTLSTLARQILDALPATYTEVSPSGRGLHLLLLVDATLARRRGVKRAGVEVYFDGRFLTVTGERYADSPLTLAEATPQLAALVQARPSHQGRGPEVGADFRALTGEDQDFLTALRTVDPVAYSLWRGDWQGRYRTHSEADFALLSLLRGYGADPGRLQRVFRASGLYRPKTDSRRPAGTYLTHSIAEILARGET